MWDSDAWYIWLMMLLPIYFMFICLSIIMIISAYVRGELIGILAIFLPYYYPFIFVFFFWYNGPGKFFSHPYGYFYYFDVFWNTHNYLIYADDSWYLILDFNFLKISNNLSDCLNLLKFSIFIYFLVLICVLFNLYFFKIFDLLKNRIKFFFLIDLILLFPILFTFFFFLFEWLLNCFFYFDSFYYFSVTNECWDIINLDFFFYCSDKKDILNTFFFFVIILFAIYLFIYLLFLLEQPKKKAEFLLFTPFFFFIFCIFLKFSINFFKFGELNFLNSIFFFFYIFNYLTFSDDSWYLILTVNDNLWGSSFGFFFLICAFLLIFLFFIFCDAWNYIFNENFPLNGADFFLYLPFIFMFFVVIFLFIYIPGDFLLKFKVFNYLWPDWNYCYNFF